MDENQVNEDLIDKNQKTLKTTEYLNFNTFPSHSDIKVYQT